MQDFDEFDHRPSMVKVALTCLLKKKFKGGKVSSSFHDDEHASSFCSSVYEDLEKLGKLLIDGVVSLQWSAEAINLLKRMQAGLLKLVESSKFPISSSECENLFNQFMNETINLLDLCNSLKSATSRIERYRFRVEFATRKILNSETESLETELRKLPDEIEKQRDLNSNSISSIDDKFKKGTDPVMYLFKITIVTLSMLLASAIVAPISIDMDGSQFPQSDSIVSPLKMVVDRFRRAQWAGVVEHETVRKAVAVMKAQMGKNGEKEEVLKSVEKLKEKCDDLKKGADDFGSAVDELFEEVIKGRNKMMEMFNS